MGEACALGPRLSIKRLIEALMAASKSAPARPDRHAALVLAAYRQIAEHGFEGLRTREVAAEAGVNIATLHYYFPTKERLVQGVVEHAMDRFRTTLTPRGSPADQLRTYLRGVRRLLKDEPQLALVMGELGLRASRDPDLAYVMGGMYTLWLRLVRGMLKRAARDGTISREHDSDDVAALIVATLSAAANPAIGAGKTADQSIRQLERWLGLAGRNTTGDANDSSK
jgi:AcrR family transcriptional regulator